ncbi:unnamed protein product [Rotaria magnacalcarata]
MYCVGQLSISPSAQCGGIYITDNDTVYIANSVNNRIVIVSPNSTTASAIIGSDPGNSLTQLNYPVDLFVTSGGIYVLDPYNYRVVEWNKNETNSTSVAETTGVSGGTMDFNKFGISYQIFFDVFAGTSTAGDGPCVLYCPYGIFVDNALTLYIADKYNHRIQRWKFNACWGDTVADRVTQTGISLYLLNYPTAVVLGMNPYMHICDKNNNRILRWAPDACAGDCIAGCSMTTEASINQLNSPFTIVFDSQGSLYVSDTGNNRVQKFLVYDNQLSTTTTTTTSTSRTTSSATSITTSTSRPALQPAVPQYRVLQSSIPWYQAQQPPEPVPQHPAPQQPALQAPVSQALATRHQVL